MSKFEKIQINDRPKKMFTELKGKILGYLNMDENSIPKEEEESFKEFKQKVLDKIEELKKEEDFSVAFKKMKVEDIFNRIFPVS